jgi:hypothetical protein
MTIIESLSDPTAADLYKITWTCLLTRNPGRGERRGFRSGRSRGLGESVIVLSMEQSDTTASSGFMIAEAERRFLRVFGLASRRNGPG